MILNEKSKQWKIIKSLKNAPMEVYWITIGLCINFWTTMQHIIVLKDIHNVSNKTNLQKNTSILLLK